MSKKRPSTSSAPAGISPRLPYVLAGLATVLWIGGLLAYALGLHSRLGPFEDEGFAIVVLALLGLGPVGLVWVGAVAFNHGARLLAEAARLQTLSEQMLAPAALAAAGTGSAVETVRLQIQGAVDAAERARTELLGLRDALAEESQRAVAATSGSAESASALVQTLGRERQELGALSGHLEGRVGEIGEVIARHARLVAEASDLAQAQIQEAEALLAARAADLSVAADGATRAARTAEGELSRQTDRLEQAGAALGDQAQVVEAGLGQQRAALIALAHGLRAEQEDLAVQFESRRAQLIEVQRQSEQGALQVGESAAQSAQTLRDLIAASAEVARTAVESASGELLASARTASQELESLDSAFQERVKRNYEMLSEAVRLMGVLAGGAPRSAAPLVPRPSPIAPSLPLRPRNGLSFAGEDLGLRPRLTPRASDGEDDGPEPYADEDEDGSPFPAPQGDPDLSWDELIAALEENDPDEADLERIMIAQIEALGIDTVALIPRRRLDDVARLYEGGDVMGARALIHEMAPAAVRKLARRVLSDRLMRAQADRLVDRYAGLLQGASRRGGEGLTMASLLSSDAGRAFLLLDAASGDFG
jgi:hypothetical protein